VLTGIFIKRKRLCGTPEHRLKDQIEFGRKEIGQEGVRWIHLAEDRDH
jgi:hypothetical protein